MHAPMKVIRAELRGSDEASACGVAVRGSSPVVALCRQLVAAGYDPTTPLEAYRGDMHCLHVRSIGEAAEVEIAAHGVGFRKRHRGNEDGPPYSDETPTEVHAMWAAPEITPDPLVLVRSTKVAGDANGQVLSRLMTDQQSRRNWDRK
jgi:hypothetical protein